MMVVSKVVMMAGNWAESKDISTGIWLVASLVAVRALSLDHKMAAELVGNLAGAKVKLMV
jgi:hypothetical protein